MIRRFLAWLRWMGVGRPRQLPKERFLAPPGTRICGTCMGNGQVPPSWFGGNPICPTCNGRGWIPTQEDSR